MKILETAALADEVYFAFIDLAAKYSDRFSFEMNEPISEKAVQTKRNIIMETITDGSAGMEMKERIVAQQLDALVCAPVETLQYYTCCIPYMRLMERHELKGAEPGGRPPVLRRQPTYGRAAQGAAVAPRMVRNGISDESELFHRAERVAVLHQPRGHARLR